MLARVEELAGLLRDNGVRVSTSEVIDAARAAEAVGPRDPRRFRAALRASLVKRPGDGEVFDELFDLYFLRGASGFTGGDRAPLAAALEGAGISPEDARRLIEALAERAMAMGPVARAGAGLRSPEVAALIRAAGERIELDQIATPLQVGFYAYRLLDALGVRGAEDEVAAALRALADAESLSPDVYALLAELVRERFAELRRGVRSYVEQEFRRRNLDFSQRVASMALADKPLARLTEAEIAELRHELHRLARILRAKVSLRPKVKTRGRLDLRRTLRRSLSTGGVPFEIRRRERQRKKPRLVVLCDISDSVRNVSRFMLELVYTLHDLFDRVDSFAFVAEIGELTELFARYDIDRAVELAYAGEVCNVFANSNYGKALAQFADRYVGKVTSRTTVIVIGDGRNNYHPSRAEVLEEIARRARRVLWLNPEAPAAWGFGDSAMREYEPHCDEVVVAHDLESLRKVIDDLVLA